MAQLPSQSQFGNYSEWPGRDVLDSGGERLGGVREIYLDRETGRPEWVLVEVDGHEARFVPLADASVEASTIRVAHSADAIRSAPGIGSEPRIDQSEERQLYAHYGLGYSETDSGSGLPEEPRASGPTPTAWGGPDSTDPERATPTGWGDSTSSLDEPEAPPWRADTTEASTSPSTVGEEPSNFAPPPADPPSVEELEAADIPAPSADFVAPFAVSTDPPEDAVTLFEVAPESAAAPTVETPFTMAPAEPAVAASASEILGSVPETPPTVPHPPRIHSVPPLPPEEESEAAGFAEHKTLIAAGLVLAAVLLLLLRRVR